LYELETDPYRTRRAAAGSPTLGRIPQEITVILGDVIQALRTALDHLAYQLFLVGTGGNVGVGKHIYFPIARDAAEYRGGSPRKLVGLRQDAIDKIGTLEPYGGGKGKDFWILHSLNNTDKHRALVAAGSSFRSVDLLPVMMESMPAAMRDAFAAAVPKLSLAMKPADNLCPLKVGDELLVGAADGALNPDVQFRFEVALHEPDVVEPGPMLEIVHHLADLISSTITAFKPLLA